MSDSIDTKDPLGILTPAVSNGDPLGILSQKKSPVGSISTLILPQYGLGSANFQSFQPKEPGIPFTAETNAKGISNPNNNTPGFRRVNDHVTAVKTDWSQLGKVQPPQQSHEQPIINPRLLTKDEEDEYLPKLMQPKNIRTAPLTDAEQQRISSQDKALDEQQDREMHSGGRSWANLPTFSARTIFGGLEKDEGDLLTTLADKGGNMNLAAMGMKDIAQSAYRQSQKDLQIAQQNQLPGTTGGRLATAAVGFGPDLIELAATPELDIAKLGKLGEVVTKYGGKYGTKVAELATGKFPIQQSAKGLINSYADAINSGKTSSQANVDAAKGFLKGYGSGVLMDIGAEGANGLTKVGGKALEDVGLMSGNKLVAGTEKRLLHATAQGLTFSAIPFVQNALQGKDTSLDDVKNNGLFGFVLGGITGTHGEKGEPSDADKAATQVIARAPLIDMNNFMESDMDAIKSIHNNNESAADLHAVSVANAEKGFNETDDEQKQQSAIQSSLAGKASSVKSVTDAILKDKNGVIEGINQLPIPDELKQPMIDKVNQVHQELDPIEQQKKALSDQIQTLTDTPADGIIAEKEKAVRLKDLNKQLDEVVANQYDQQKDRTSGKKITYSKGVGEEDGKFFKTTDGKKEPIEESRYNLERQTHEKPAQNEPATENGLPEKPQEVPAEKANEESTNNQITNPKSDEKTNEERGQENASNEKGRGEKTVAAEEEVSKPGAENAPELTPSAAMQAYFDVAKRKYPDMNIEDVKKKALENAKTEGRTDPSLEDFAYAVKQITRPEDIASEESTTDEPPKPKESAQQSEKNKTTDQAKAIADKIRALKSDKSLVYGGLHGIATAVYDGALETAATVIEQGGKLVDAIKAAVDHIKNNSDEKDEDKIRAAITKDLTDAGIQEQSEDEKATYGTKNAITEELQQGLGLPPIEIPKDRSDEESLAVWKNGTRTPQEIVEQLLNPDTNIYDKSITPNDEPIMREYIRQLGERGRELNKIKVHLQEHADAGNEQAAYDVQSVGVQIDRHLDEYNNALNASKVGGNVWHKYGDERQKAIDDQGLMLNAIERIKNIYGKDIPADIKTKLDELQKKHDELVAKNEILEQKAKKAGAQANFEKAKPKKTVFGTKRLSDAEFAKVKTDTLSDLKKDWKKSFGNTYSTLPGLPQFNALAPHITKLMKLYADRGITKIDEVINHIYNDIKDDVDITKDDISDIIAGRYSEHKPLSDLQKQVNGLRIQARNKIKLAELEKGIIAKTKAKGDASLEVKSLQKQVLELKKQAINQYADLSADQLKKEQATIQKKIDKGEFFKLPAVKTRFENDPQWLKNNKEKANLMFQLRKMETEAMNSRKSAYMRRLDLSNRWGRRAIFIGANAVYTHLASSAVIGSLLHRWPEFVAGKVINKIFPLLAKGAPIEGFLSLKTEAKFWRRIINFQQTIKNTGSIFMTGETRLSKELSTRPHENVIPGLDFLAAGGHQAIKDPILEATFDASQEAYMDYYRTHAIDETHPLMLEAARQAGWQRSQYEIFQNTAKNANAIKTWINQLEKKSIINAASDTKYDRIKGNAQYTAVALYRFMVPINTAPTNMVDRSVLAWRLPDKIAKAIDANGALKKGIDKLSADEKDLLLLQLKKGAVGAFYWTAGFMLGGTAAGGLYTKFYPNKDRDQTATDPDSQYLNLGGVNVGKDWQHNYQLQSLQNGATWKMVYGHYRNDKGESMVGSFLKAGFATTEAVGEQLPTVKAAADLKEAGTTPQGEEKYLKNLKRRVGVKKVQDLSKLMGYNLGDMNDDK